MDYHSIAYLDGARDLFQLAKESVEQGAFTRPYWTNDAESRARWHVEGDVLARWKKKSGQYISELNGQYQTAFTIDEPASLHPHTKQLV